MNEKEEYQPIGRRTDKNGKTYIKCENAKGNHKWYDSEKEEYVVGNPFKYDNIGIKEFDSKEKALKWIKKRINPEDDKKLWYINSSYELFKKYRKMPKYEQSTFILVRLSRPPETQDIAMMDVERYYEGKLINKSFPIQYTSIGKEFLVTLETPEYGTFSIKRLSLTQLIGDAKDYFALKYGKKKVVVFDSQTFPIEWREAHMLYSEKDKERGMEIPPNAFPLYKTDQRENVVGNPFIKNSQYHKTKGKIDLKINCSVTGEINCRCGQKKINDRNAHITEVVDVKATLRKLFTDHAVYTKFVINAIVDAILDEIKDRDVLIQRLLDNQVDIGNQVKLVIEGEKGEEIGNKLTVLLTKHIELAKEVITSAKSDKPELKKNVEALFKNSDEVSEFLTSLNPVILESSKMKEMFRTHNQFVIDMTNLRKYGKWKEEQEKFDAYYNQILDMSDHIYRALSTKSK